MPRVEAYEFGEIVIDGRRYRRDVIIFPEKIRDNWWRKEGHSLCLDDLKEVLEYNPEVLVIGTGYYGFMRVPDEVRRYLEQRGIEVHIAETRRACEVFNELINKGRRVVAALHLTC
ncbi:MAG: hypothetical protein DRN15_10760 [Thermoprotei archaeon]|nr:MAG: hypothetical protein DRM97_07520 [Thermoprotei archaeon]RLF21676.1 MAG: hypothetical protein DRN15_10760 [Thermoprotei archaeon]